MKVQEFIDNVLKPGAAKMLQLTESKGEEYKAGDADQFANFNRQARDLGLDRKAILMVYLSKHLDSIRNFVRLGDKAKLSEPIAGRIEDAILYLYLLLGMVKDDQAQRDAEWSRRNGCAGRTVIQGSLPAFDKEALRLALLGSSPASRHWVARPSALQARCTKKAHTHLGYRGREVAKTRAKTRAKKKRGRSAGTDTAPRGRSTRRAAGKGRRRGR
jgi:hypothetical protein